VVKASYLAGKGTAGGPVPSEPNAARAVIVREPRLGLRMAPPPDVPPGWQTGPPDFVGVGTIRSGTTWWNYLIHTHPDVVRAASRKKEVHYFDQFPDTAQRASAEEYYAYFPRPAGKKAGEWTPRYMFDSWTPPLLARIAPDAKLLVLLRDPVERLISALTYTRYKFHTEPDEQLAWREFTRSLYGNQLQCLLEHFPREQVLVLQYERCVRETALEAARTFEFLGLDPGLQLTARHAVPRNPTRWQKVTLGGELSDRCRDGLRADLSALAELCPSVDQALWPSARL
jgi:Sulfotransferase domain